jgi:hypothetical protein
MTQTLKVAAVLSLVVLCTVGSLLALAKAAAPPTAASTSGKLGSAARLEQLWADLASSDVSKSARAVLALSATPKQTVSFLGQRLHPVKVDPKRVARLIDKLDSEAFEDRETAYRELEYQGKYIKALLEKALEGKLSAEMRHRVQRLLWQVAAEDPKPPAPPVMRGMISVRNTNGKIEIIINGKKLDLTPRVIEKPGPLASWQRALRAVAVLEHIGTPEARRVLQTLAGGEKDAAPTKAASEALKRMQK